MYLFLQSTWQWFDEAISFFKLTSRHPTHVHDNHTSLQTKCAQFRAIKTLPLSGFVSENTLGLEASCHFALAMGKRKEPHTK